MADQDVMSSQFNLLTIPSLASGISVTLEHRFQTMKTSVVYRKANRQDLSIMHVCEFYFVYMVVQDRHQLINFSFHHTPSFTMSTLRKRKSP